MLATSIQVSDRLPATNPHTQNIARRHPARPTTRPGHRNGPAATPESIVARAHARRTLIARSNRNSARRAGPTANTTAAAPTTTTMPPTSPSTLATRRWSADEADQERELQAHAPQRPQHADHQLLDVRPGAVTPLRPSQLVDDVHH